MYKCQKTQWLNNLMAANIMYTKLLKWKRNFHCKCLSFIDKEVKNHKSVDTPVVICRQICSNLYQSTACINVFNRDCFYFTTVYFLKGSYDAISSFAFSLSVTSCLCIDEIPELPKTKVSKPKRYSLSKLRLDHAPLKRLIQTRPHMSTSRCGNFA